VVGTLGAQIGVLPQKDTTLSGATDEKFKVGDEWEYRTRKSEEKSTLTILRVESSPELSVVVHVAVNKIRLAYCHGGPSPDSVPHMPFARRALNDSVTKKIATDRSLPDYKDGYNEWKEDCFREFCSLVIFRQSEHGKGCGCIAHEATDI